MSLGPGSQQQSSPFSDASARVNRRTSFGGGSTNNNNNKSDDDSNNVSGGGGGGEGSTELKQDINRAQLLDEWRRNRNKNKNGGSASGGNQQQQHLLPPSSAPTPSNRSNRIHRHDDSYDGNNASFEQVEERTTLTRSANSRYDTMPSMAAASSSSSQQFDSYVGGGGGEDHNHNTNSSSSTATLSALDRYRLRRQGQPTSTPTPPTSSSNGGIGSAEYPINNNNLKPLPSSHSSSSPVEDDQQHEHASVVVGGGGSSSSNAFNFNLGTPSRKNKSRGGGSSLSSSLCGGAQRRVRSRTSLAPSDFQPSISSSSYTSSGMPQISEQLPASRKLKPLLPPSYPTSGSEREKYDKEENVMESSLSDRASCLPLDHRHTETSSSYSTVEAPPSYSTSHNNNDSNESVDVAVLQSRLNVMKRRNEILEREKMELNMSKAPLEARMRQMESAWVKERERLVVENEKLQQTIMDADERCRELFMQNEVLVEEKQQMNQARANNPNIDVEGGGVKDAWSERLKTSNEIKDLRNMLKTKDEDIKLLRVQNVSLEGEVFGCRSEIESLERNYNELEKDYQELEMSKSQNSEAEIQLQVLTT